MPRCLERLVVDVECVVDDLDGSLSREDARTIGVLRALRRVVFGGVVLVAVGGAPDYELRDAEDGRTVGEVTVSAPASLRLAS